MSRRRGCATALKVSDVARAGGMGRIICLYGNMSRGPIGRGSGGWKGAMFTGTEEPRPSLHIVLPPSWLSVSARLLTSRRFASLSRDAQSEEESMNQIRKVATLVSICVLLAGPALAGEGPIPSGITNLDHVFVIMMENHAYGQIVGNPSSPFTNKYMTLANTSTNYFAIAHPSLTNYLEVVGGSNFWVLNDNS